MNLANLLDDLGQRAEARDLYEQVIAGYTSQLVHHTRTLDAKMNLATLLDDLGQRAEAREFFMNKSSLGTPLSWVRTTKVHWMQKMNSATLLADLGQRAEARTLMNKSSPGTPPSWARTTRIH